MSTQCQFDTVKVDVDRNYNLLTSSSGIYTFSTTKGSNLNPGRGPDIFELASSQWFHSLNR